MRMTKELVDVFVQRTWGEVIADNVVTEEERARLWTVVDGLHLPEAVVPAPMWAAISRRR